MLVFLLSSFASLGCALATSSTEVIIKNGTLLGLHVAEWDQDHFLGIPYAQPPVGDLRFRWPQSINSSFDGVLNATNYGQSCYQYNSKFSLSEDCLTLNVVRPAGYESQALPVLVWIYGGGLYAGSSADPQYNLSGLVQTSTYTANPFIAVSINYRLGVWGFLNTPHVQSEGSLNAGLLDQRLALQWIQENIQAFGGDPTRVTIWGESAGAQSIGLHLHSFDGRDDGLYSAAIMESGGPQGAAINALPFYQSAVQNLTRTVGCPQDWTSASQLQCLRQLTSEELFASNYSVTWNPVIDGTFLTDHPGILAEQGKFVRVPILTGANTDEGVSFSVHSVTSEQDIFNSLLYWRNYNLSPASIRRLLQLYPNNPSIEPPYSDHTNSTAPYGAQWRRYAAIGGDIVMIAQRRATAERYAAEGQKVWSYRFDTAPYNAAVPGSVKHFDNVAFSFQNISGLLGPAPESYRVLSTAIGKLYANFVAVNDPNGLSGNSSNVTTLPYWPQYTLEQPRNIVLNASGSFIEDDVWRKEGIAFLNTIWQTDLGS